MDLTMSYEEFLDLIGNNIRYHRKRQKFTLNRLAQASFMRWTQIRDIENGRANPTLRTLNKIAEALGVDIKDICKANSNKK